MTTHQVKREKRAEHMLVVGAVLMVAAGIGWVYFLNLLLRPYTVPHSYDPDREWECASSLSVLFHDTFRRSECEGRGEAHGLIVALLALLVVLTAAALYLTLRSGYLTRYHELKRRVDSQHKLLRSLGQRLDEQEARLAAGAEGDSAEKRGHTRRAADTGRDTTGEAP